MTPVPPPTPAGPTGLDAPPARFGRRLAAWLVDWLLCSAITFGPLDSAPIEAARASERHYALLEELGTRPRTTYLARRRDRGGAA